jgi:hypothetical protein
MEPEYCFTDSDLEYLSKFHGQTAALARELLQYRHIMVSMLALKAMYPEKFDIPP